MFQIVVILTCNGQIKVQSLEFEVSSFTCQNPELLSSSENVCGEEDDITLSTHVELKTNIV